MVREFLHTKTLPFWFPAILCVACSVLLGAAWFNAKHLPSALTVDDQPNHGERFIAEYAQNHTIDLGNLGPKVPGSAANRLAKEMLLRKIDEIKSFTHSVHRLEVDVQTANGSFLLGTILTSVYADVQNVIVRLSPANQTPEHSLLLNSHYDSVPVSYGASDDTFMVAIMLETLRVLASSDIPHRHAIVFLFNNAEENGLIGAHGFVQSHKWSHNIGGLINLDAIGSGGKDRLFRVSHGAGWLMRAYAAVVPHPRGNVAVQELVEAGMVPSETDFRIFSKFGNILGVDIAMSDNGYVYHTEYDRPEIIPSGSYQQVGDNVLALTRMLANADEVGSLNNVSEEVVFFDFLGWFMIVYGTGAAVVINLCVSVAVMALAVLTLKSYAWKSDTTFLVMLVELTLIIAVQLATIILAASLVGLAAFLYDAIGRPLSWYTHVWLISGLYGAPLIVGLLAGPAAYLLVYRRRLSQSLHLHHDFESIMLVVRRSYHIQLFLHAHAVLLAMALIVLTAIGFRSAYVVLIGLMFYGVATLVNYVFRLNVHDTRWMYVHLAGQVTPIVFYANMFVEVLDPMVAILARKGSVVNPEIAMGTFVFVMGLLAWGFLVPMIGFVRRPIWWLGGAALVWLIAIVVMFTPVGFPYRTQTSEQRFYAYHTDRIFHTLNESEAQCDQGYFLLGMDRNSNRVLNDIFSNEYNATSAGNLCDSHLFCGLPMFSSGVLRLVHDSLWLQTNKSAMIPDARATLTLISTEPTSNDTVRRYTFELSGPDHMSLYLSPSAQHRLVNWTFANGAHTHTKLWHDRPTYFVLLLSATDAIDRHTVRFMIEIEKTSSHLESALNFDIAAVGRLVHKSEMLSANYRDLLAKFPVWAHITPEVCSYESWQF